MLQAHSFLWHYGWIAPNILTLGLAICIFYRGLHRRFPVFFFYLLFVPIEELTLYLLDISPRVPALVWWQGFWVGTFIEGVLKFAVVAELVQYLLQRWPSVAKSARNLVSGAGVLLVITAAVAAGLAAPDNVPRLIGGGHILAQTLYLTQAGLIISIFVIAGVFRIPWDRYDLGRAIGLAIVWCGHLAVWALISGGLVRNRGWEDLANMATYHLAVLVWFYYLLVPEKRESLASEAGGSPRESSAEPPVSLDAASGNPEETLEEWNRELERLIHQ